MCFGFEDCSDLRRAERVSLRSCPESFEDSSHSRVEGDKRDDSSLVRDYIRLRKSSG